MYNENLINLSNNNANGLRCVIADNEKNFSYILEDVRISRIMLQSLQFAYENDELNDEEIIYGMKGLFRNLDEIEQMTEDYMCRCEDFEEAIIHE